MKSEKIRLHIIEILPIVFLLLAMIFEKVITRQILGIVLLVYMFISLKIIKLDKIKLINSSQIITIMSSFALIYVAILYIIGIYTGYYNATVKLSLWSTINYIIPYIVIILSSEMIRKSIILKGDKKSKIIILISTVMLDVIMYTNIYNLKSVNDYFTLTVFIIFSSIANNILYNYIVTKYRNEKAIIIYRLITTLYMYIIPIVPDIYIFYEAIIKLIIPYIIYVILELLYGEKRKIVVSTTQKRIERITYATSCIIVTIIIMLISCNFRYGVLVIGSGSMTGTINKGDIVVYERYDQKENIETGEVIIFQKEDVKIVHRVIDQRNLGDGIRYYTKGDANEEEDEGYREKPEIIGKVKAKIPYIGYLTLWLNDMCK